MSSRLQRLWHPGDPRVRVFLPDFWLKLIESPKKGYKRQPKNVATFEVDPRMSVHDVREYLEKIYKLPVRAVSTMNVMGRITWDFPLDRFKRTALWKEEDKKVAFVYFKKGFEAEYPDLFVDSEMKREDDEMESRMSRINEGDRNEQNRKYLNKDRAGVGEFLPL